jgi:hypothetical protein
MNNTLFITNKTGKPMRATISENYTGGNIFTFDLKPGNNEIKVNSLETGVYVIQLEDEEHIIFYKQKIIKD